MTQTILLLVALFSAVIIAISFYYNTKPFKFFTIGILFVLANSIYFSIDGVKGWPAEEPNNVKGILASVVILNPTDSNPGAIYIGIYPRWAPKWYEYVYPRLAPKTYYVKYSNDRAAQFQKAATALNEGQEVRINGIPPEKSGKTGGEQNDGLISTLINSIKKKLLKNGDTYKPDIPDIEYVVPNTIEKMENNQ